MQFVSLKFDLRVYRINALKKAAYKFGDVATFQIQLTGEHEAEVSIQSKDADSDIAYLRADYSTEVLDQELREVVLEETGAIRNLLLAQAFSPISLIQPLSEQSSACDN